MKRPFRGFEVVCLAAGVAGGIGCTPSNSVKPGAPVLIEVSIVERGGATITKIPSGEASCGADVTDGGGCDPAGAVTTCFLTSASNWCRCVANMAPAAPMPTPSCTDGGTDAGAGGAGGTGAGGMGGGAADASADASSDAATDAPTPPAGTWNCAPFAPTAQALFVFDRLLDTRPFDVGDAGTPVAAARVTSQSAGALAPDVLMSNADYRPNGSPGEIVFPIFFGDFRADGPSLLVAAVPALPAGRAVTFKLDGTMVRAKDGKTPFTDNDNFGKGSLTFTTGLFSATVTPPSPPPLPADAGACATPNTLVALDAAATIAFNSPVDPTALMSAVTATIDGTTNTVPVVLTSKDGLNLTVAPMDKWPANASITIAVDATAADLAGDTLGTAAAALATADFQTGAQ